MDKAKAETLNTLMKLIWLYVNVLLLELIQKIQTSLPETLLISEELFTS